MPEGGSGGPGPNGDRADQDDKRGGGVPPSSQKSKSGKAAPVDDEMSIVNAAELEVPARPSAPVPPLGAVVPGTLPISWLPQMPVRAMWHAGPF
jgi:hypothetical protein